MAEAAGCQSQSWRESGYSPGGDCCKQVTSKTQVDCIRQKVGGHCCFWGASHQDQVWDRNQFKRDRKKKKKLY